MVILTDPVDKLTNDLRIVWDYCANNCRHAINKMLKFKPYVEVLYAF